MAYLILKGEMAKRDVSIEAVANLLGIHRNSVAYKLDTGRFAIDEAKNVRDAFFPKWSIEELFEQTANQDDPGEEV